MLFFLISPHPPLSQRARNSVFDTYAPKIENPKLFHRITRSALASTFYWMVTPICLARFEIDHKLELFGLLDRKIPPGLAPLRILPTKMPAARAIEIGKVHRVADDATSFGKIGP